MTAKLKELQTLKRIFWCLALCICIVIFSYAYFVNKIVHTVAERQKTQVEINNLTSKISELEFQSISISNKINPEYAYALGFKEVRNQQYVTRKSESVGLSLRTRE